MKNEFAYLYPFHLILSNQLTIDSYGISLSHFFPKMQQGDDFLQTWIIDSPEVDINDPNLLPSLIGKEVLITKNSKLNLQFKGTFDHYEKDRFIFIGNPVINTQSFIIQSNLLKFAEQNSDSLKDLLKTFKSNNLYDIDLKDILIQISRLKKIEEELQNALNTNKAAAESKEAFIANMSHEIRTPLNGIIGMLRELNKEFLSVKQQSFVDNALKASKHLLSIINNILDLSKIKAGELKLTRKTFSFNEVIDDVYTILKGQSANKNIEFNFNIDSSIAQAHKGDATRIRQILINLLGNSLKFTETGSVSLNIELISNQIIKEKIRISIIDTGIGMSDSFIEKVFTKFQQEDSSRARRHAGTGLGMAITKELVQLMKGNIHLESKKGEGTKVFIELTFPIGDPSKIEKKTDNSTFKHLENIKILLVEDNEMNRYVASNALKPYVSEIFEVENGEKAISFLKENTPDLILMDLQMPLMGGVEATKIIREKMSSNIPIIALTANAFKSEIDKCINAGMNNYVTKPFEEKQLLKVIEKEIKKTKSISKSTIKKPEYSLKTLKEMSRGDYLFVENMLKLFVNNTPKSVEQINQSIESKDIETIKKVAHKIKPSLINLGMKTLHEKVREIEYFEISEDRFNEFISKTKSFCEDLSEISDLIKANELN
jgi:signal transduction histidine kinase/CheY-like chemotaxis protein/HPt (histidine-containing phosphotransfer) domain-containing protein